MNFKAIWLRRALLAAAYRWNYRCTAPDRRLELLQQGCYPITPNGGAGVFRRPARIANT
jgi:hypothetical protein